MTARNGVLTDEEIARLLEAYLSGAGPQTEERLTELVRWAERTRTAAECLDLLLTRAAVVTEVEDGEPRLALRTGERVEVGR